MTRTHNPTKYIFVTGGVASSLGKGIAASALGAILEARGLRISFVKLDPYLNIDPGTLNPKEHGEVFVTEDGAVTDLDLGHYERFSTALLSKQNNFTSGQIYHKVLSKEREGAFLGGTVQVVPHITEEIKRSVRNAAEGHDILIVEVGGTVGDIESLPFLEAIRQMRFEEGPKNTVLIHVTLVPFIAAAGELKTKPSQHSVKELRSIGLSPDILIPRADRLLGNDIKRKLALHCNVPQNHVIQCPDLPNIYEIPLHLHNEGADERVVEHLGIWARAPQLDEWEQLAHTIRTPSTAVTVAIVGKYISLTESYKSLNEALTHGGYHHRCEVHLRFVDAEDVERDGAAAFLSDVDAILVPGGFGRRGSEGKIAAIQYAREQRIPFLGVSLGMQMIIVEYARNVANLKDANSTEFMADTPNPVIHLPLDPDNDDQPSDKMRLGAYPCELAENSLAARIYKTRRISERHRHRYEFNPEYRDALERAGLKFSGISPEHGYVEVVELDDHPWFLGCHFHPEFKSRPTSPHPLFRDYIAAAMEFRDLRAAE